MLEIDEDEEEGSKKYVAEFSGRLLLEIIWKDCGWRERSVEDAKRVKQVLSKNPYVEMAAIAADGRELLVTCPLHVEDDRDFRRSMDAIISYFDLEYGLSISSYCRDPTDISPITYDPELIINQDAVIFDVEAWENGPGRGRLVTLDEFVEDASGTLPWEQKWYDLFDPPSPQETASGEVRVLFDASKHQLASASPSFTDQDYKEMMDCISGYEDYSTWIDIGMALKAEPGEDEYSFWKNWSEQATNYCGEEELQKKWRSLNPNQITGATLTHLAKTGGWQHNRSKTLPNPQQSTEAESPLSEPAAAEQTADSKGSGSSEHKPNLQTIVTRSGETKFVPNLLNVNELFKVEKFSIWFDTFTGKIQAIRGKLTLEWSDHQTLRVARHFQSKYAGLERISRETID